MVEKRGLNQPTNSPIYKVNKGKEVFSKVVARRILFLISCSIAIFILVGLSLSLGSAQISFLEAYTAIFAKLFPAHFGVSDLAATVVWHLRLPRTIMAVLAGASFGMGGCIIMAITRNPLATPYTIGVSAGAGFGAAIAIILGKGLLVGPLLTVGNAFVFSLFPAIVVLLLSRRSGTTPTTIILSGIAMSYIFSAGNTLLQFFAEAEAVRATVFWLVGDLSRADWWQIPYALAILLISTIVSMRFAWDLNIMKTDDDTAKGLGVEVEKVRRISLGIACLSTATIVSFTGAIGFVCLLSPHISRMFVGEDERYLIPASGLFGAALLLVSDIVARRAVAPIMLPVGAITALLGGPMLLYLLQRGRS